MAFTTELFCLVGYEYSNATRVRSIFSTPNNARYPIRILYERSMSTRCLLWRTYYLCISLHTCTHANTHTHTYTHTRTHTHTQHTHTAHTRTCTHTYTHTHIHAHMYTHIHTHMYMYLHTHTNTHATHAHTHYNTQTYILTHICTCIQTHTTPLSRSWPLGCLSEDNSRVLNHDELKSACLATIKCPY